MSAGLEDFEESASLPEPPPPVFEPPPEPPPTPALDIVAPPAPPDTVVDELPPPPVADDPGMVLDYSQPPIDPIAPIDSDPISPPDWAPVAPVEMFEDGPDWESSREAFEDQAPVEVEPPAADMPPLTDSVADSTPTSIDDVPTVDDSVTLSEPPPLVDDGGGGISPEGLPSVDDPPAVPDAVSVPDTSEEAPLAELPPVVDPMADDPAPLIDDSAVSDFPPLVDSDTDATLDTNTDAQIPMPDTVGTEVANDLPSEDVDIPTPSPDPVTDVVPSGDSLEPVAELPATPESNVDLGNENQTPQSPEPSGQAEDLPPIVEEPLSDEEREEGIFDAAAAQSDASAATEHVSSLPSRAVDPDRPYRNDRNGAAYVPTTHTGIRSVMERNDGEKPEGDADHMIPKGYAGSIGIKVIRAQDLDSSRNRSLGATIDKQAKNDWAPKLLELSKSLLPDASISDRWRLAPLTTALYRAHKDNVPFDLESVRQQIERRSSERAQSPNWPKSK